MNIKQFRETFSPWFDIVTKRFQDSFSEDYDIDILAFLHENIDQEIKLVTDKHCTARRVQTLYNVLTYLYEHILWKLRKEDFPNATLSCVKLLSQLIKTGLLLTQGFAECEYIDRILTALKLFTGKPALLYDALLLVNGLKRVHHKPYSAVLRCVLKADYKDITDPLLYMEVILLFRRLRALSDSSNKTLYSLATKMKPPSNLISWLVSLNINGSISFLKLLKHKKIVQQLMRKNIPESLLKTIRHMILKSYYFEESCDTYRQMTVPKKPSDLFITETSSLLKNEDQSVGTSSNKLYLKKVNSKKEGKQRRKKQKKDSVSVKKIDLCSERTKKSTTLKSDDSHVFYIHNCSNLVAQNEQSESLHESDANKIGISSDSVAGTSKLISVDDREHRKSSKKRRKSKHDLESSVQLVELEKNFEIEIINVSDSDSLDDVSGVPSKKFRKDHGGEQTSHPCISSKRNLSENEAFEISVENDTVNTEHRKKIKYDMANKVLNEYNYNVENCNMSSGSNLGDMHIASEKEVEKASKKNSDKSSLEDAEVSFIAEVTRNKTGEDFPDRSKTSKQKSMKCSKALSKETASEKMGTAGECKDSSNENKPCDLQASSLQNNVPLFRTSSPLKVFNDAENYKVSFNQNFPRLVDVTKNEALQKLSGREDMLPAASKHCSSQHVISGNDEYTDTTADSEQSSINSLDQIKVASHSLPSSNTNGTTVEAPVEKEADINSLVSTEKVSKVKSIQLVSESSTESSGKEMSREEILSAAIESSTQSVNKKTSEHETAQKVATGESILSCSESDKQEDESLKIDVECGESINPSHSLKRSAEILIKNTESKSSLTQMSSKESKISPKYSNTDEIQKAVNLSSKNCTVTEDIVLKISPEKKNELSMDNSKCSLSSEVDDFATEVAFQSDILNDKSHFASTVNVTENTEEQSLQKCSVEVIEKTDVPSSSNTSNGVMKDVISSVEDHSSNCDLSLNGNVNNSVSRPSVKSNLGPKNIEIFTNEAGMSSCVDADVVSLDASSDKSIMYDDSLTVSKNNQWAGNTDIEPLISERDVTKANKCVEDSVKNFPTETCESESKDGVSDIETSSIVYSTIDKSTEIKHMNMGKTYESSVVLQEKEEGIVQGISFKNDISSKCKDLDNLSGECFNKEAMECESVKNSIVEEPVKISSENMNSNCTSKPFVESISATNCDITDKNSENLSQYVDKVPINQNVLLEWENVSTDICNTQSSEKDISGTADALGVSSESSELLDSNKRDFSNLSDKITNEKIVDADMKCEVSQIDIEEPVKDLTVINVESGVKLSGKSNLGSEKETEKIFDTDMKCEVSQTDIREPVKDLTVINVESEVKLSEKSNLGSEEEIEKILDTDMKCEVSQVDIKESGKDSTVINAESEVKLLEKSNLNSEEEMEKILDTDMKCEVSQIDVKVSGKDSAVINVESEVKLSEKSNAGSEEEIEKRVPSASSAIYCDNLVIKSSDKKDEKALEKITSASKASFQEVECYSEENTEQLILGESQNNSITENVSSELAGNLPQGDVKPKNTLQDSEGAGSLFHHGTNTDSLSQNLKSVDLFQGDADVESSLQCDKKTDNISQDDALSKTIHQNGVKEESTSQNDRKIYSLSQDDAKSENMLQEVTESESLSLNDGKTDSLSHDEAKSGNILQRDSEAESISQNDAKMVSLSQDNANSENIFQVDAKTDSMYQMVAKTDSLSHFSKEESSVSNLNDITVIKDNRNESSHLVLITSSSCDTDLSCGVSGNTVYPSPNKDRISKFTSETDLGEIDVVNITNDSESEAVITKNECASDGVNVIKDLPFTAKDKSISGPLKDNEICTQKVEKNLLQSTEEKTSSSEYIPYFCKNKDYVSFSDISLRNKDRNIVVDSGLKSPNSIANFSLAATAEIFCEYRNGVLCGDKSDTLSRDDVSSNIHELSDFAKSPSISSNATDEECDSLQYSSADEDPLMDETEKVSDECPCKISIETTNSSVLLKNSEDCPEHKNEADDKSNSSLPNENDSLNESIPDKKEPNETVLLRQSLRLRNKAEVKNKVKLDESPETDESSEKESKSVAELTDDGSCHISSPKSDKFTHKDLISSSTSSDKNVTDIPQTSEGKPPSQKSVSQKSVSVSKSKSKVKAKNYISPPKGYSLRYRKSRQIVDDSSNLGIDLTKLQLDSPSCSKNTRSRSTRDVKFAKLLSSEIDIKKHSDSGDLTLFTKRETRSSSAKTEQEATQNTAGYDLRTRKSIIAPGKLKI